MGTFNPDATYIAIRNEVVGIGNGNYRLVAGQPVPDSWPIEVREAITEGVGLVREELPVDDNGEARVRINRQVSYAAIRKERIGIGTFDAGLRPGQIVDDFPPEVLEVLIRNGHVREVEKVTPEKPEAPAARQRTETEQGGHDAVAALEGLSKAALIAEAEKLGVAVDKKAAKAVITAALVEHLKGADAGAGEGPETETPA